MRSNSADVVISGQTFEHIPFIWASIMEISRVLKPGGHAFIIAPSRGHIHNVQDCWRFYPDGMRALAAWSRGRAPRGVHRLPAAGHPARSPRYSAVAPESYWGDTVGVFRKPTDYPRCGWRWSAGTDDGLGEPRRWDRGNAAAATAAATTPLGTPREPWRRPVASRSMGELPKPKSFYDIPGFFWWLDRKIFSAVLKSQEDSPLGTLVELGAYQGKSAVIIGDHVREGEKFVVVDLFGAIDRAGCRQPGGERAPLQDATRQQFEHNYLALHDELPYVVQGPSSVILDHVEPGTARFVHIDASHLYEHVHGDAVATKTMMRPGGVAVFDDYRQPHTPGVAAAVWQAVFLDGLIPVALTPQKFYGVYEDPEPIATAVRELVASDKRFWSQEQEVLGRTVLRVDMARAEKTVTDEEDPAERPSVQLPPASRMVRGSFPNPAPDLFRRRRRPSGDPSAGAVGCEGSRRQPRGRLTASRLASVTPLRQAVVVVRDRLCDVVDRLVDALARLAIAERELALDPFGKGGTGRRPSSISRSTSSSIAVGGDSHRPEPVVVVAPGAFPVDVAAGEEHGPVELEVDDRPLDVRHLEGVRRVVGEHQRPLAKISWMSTSR